MARLDESDEANVRALLVRHQELTGSPRAADLLARWEAVRGLFWRVMPKGVEAVRLPQVLVKARELVAG